MGKEYNLTKYACYITNISQAVVSSFSPLLFVTFREKYGISFTLLGLLVVINFSTQLLIDLIFSFFEKYFNVEKTVKLMPFLTFAGLVIYAVMPMIFPGAAYLWIALGTVVFSVSAGLNEVLSSPVIAAIPSDNPDREMSKLHSTYAWGVVFVVLISTLYIKIFGGESWNYLALIWALVPLTAFCMFQKAKFPVVESSHGEEKGNKKFCFGIMLCFACIFLGGAAECTMTQWASGYLETAVGIPKIFGDVFGVALFAMLLGLGRTAYAKWGKNILSVMLIGMMGAFLCYTVCAISLNPAVSLVACVLTGICVSMLWPGMIILVGEKFADSTVAVYAIMAAGGDLGASVSPQLVGLISDKIALSEKALALAQNLNITAEQIGMRAGLLISALFPLLGVILLIYLKSYFKRREKI